MRKNLNGGFIGLLMLLLAVAGMIFFIVRTDLFTGKKGEDGKGQSMIEEGNDAIQRAEDVKALMEKNNKKSLSE